MPSDDVSTILGGFSSAAQGLQPFANEQMQQRAQAAPLSPYEKWLGKVMSGELSPKEAAVSAQLEQAGHPAFAQTNSPQPRQVPPRSYEPTPGAYGYQPNYQGPPSPMAQQGLAAPAQASASPSYPMFQSLAADASDPNQAPGTRVASATGGVMAGQGPGLAMEPQTRGDFNSMVGVAPLIKSKRDKSPQEIQLELLKEQGRNNRNAYSNDTRTDIAGQERERKTQEFAQTAEFKQKQLSQQWQICLAKISAYQRVASMKTGSSEKIQAARIAVAQEAAKLKAIQGTFMTDAYLTQNPQVIDFANKLNSEVEARAATIDQVLNEKMNNGGTLPTETTSTSTKTPVHTPASLNALFGK